MLLVLFGPNQSSELKKKQGRQVRQKEGQEASSSLQVRPKLAELLGWKGRLLSVGSPCPLCQPHTTLGKLRLQFPAQPEGLTGCRGTQSESWGSTVSPLRVRKGLGAQNQGGSALVRTPAYLTI